MVRKSKTKLDSPAAKVMAILDAVVRLRAAPLHLLAKQLDLPTPTVERIGWLQRLPGSRSWTVARALVDLSANALAGAANSVATILVDNKSVRNQMRKIGYARVSTTHQNLDRQIAALRSEGCDEIFQEKVSGRDTKNRPQLEKAIDALGKGDILIVPEWDRATRSMLDGVHVIERIHARGALLKVLDKPHLDLTTPIGRGFIAFLSALAEDERQRIVKRANVTAGRPPRLEARGSAASRS